MKNPSFLFVVPKQLRLIPDFSQTSRRFIYKKYENIRDHFDLGSHQRPTYRNVAEYLGISEEKLREWID